MSDNKIKITEESNVHEEWYMEAKKQTLESLPEFMSRLANNYSHDYGTICHALAVSAIGAAHAMNRTSQGGITCFQSGAVMWEFIKNWTSLDNQPLELIKYHNMLFPQYESEFDKVISGATHGYLIKEAEKLLNERDHNDINPNVLNHWKSIIAGKIPFGYRVEGE